MSKRPLAIALVCVSSLLVSACVTKDKYQAVRRQLADTEALLAAHQAEEAQREATQSESRKRAEAQLAELKAALATAQEEASEGARELARLSEALAAAEDDLQALREEVGAKDRELAEVIKRRAALKTSIDQMGQALSELTQRKLMAERRVAEYRDMLTRFRTLIDAGQLDVRIVEGRMVLTLPMDILFATGRTELSAEGKTALAQVGQVLATIPEKQFMVEGHTDDVPIHNQRFASNWELSAGRALVVVHTLRKAGVADAQLAAGAFGEHHPRVVNTDDTSRAKNRRIEIVIVPDLRGLPGYEELERLAGE